MRNPTFIAAMLAVTSASVAAAQASPAPVTTRATTIFTIPNASEQTWAIDFSGSPGAKFVYYVSATEVRAYDRTRKTTAVILKGDYRHVASAPAGDRLVLLRLAEGSTPGSNPDRLIWTMAVNPQTGAAAGEARRVSTTPAHSPRLSPDGKQIAFIATGTPRKMIVMPANGGVERVLFEASGHLVGEVRWSPDGKWIYFGERSSSTDLPMVISRVSVDGGTPVPMTPPVGGSFPGLTPDGRYIVAYMKSVGTGTTFGIFDLEKRLVASVKATKEFGESRQIDWSGDDLRMMEELGIRRGVLHSVSVPGGFDRNSPLGNDVAALPTFSPDGKQIALALPSDRSYWELTVMNADGSGRRSIALLWNIPQALFWSPDSRFIVYHGERYRSLVVTEVATGRSTKIGNAELNISDVQWAKDSRSFRYNRQDGTPTRLKAFVMEATVEGQERQIFDLTPYLPAEGEPWYGGAWFFGDSSLLAFRQGLVVPLDGGPARSLYDPAPMPVDVKGSVARTKKDGRWVAVPSADRRSVQMISFDGRIRNTVRLPGDAVLDNWPFPHDQKNPSGFVAITTSATTPQTIWFLPVDGGAPRRLVTLASGETVNDFSMSPDGQTLFYRRQGPLTMQFVEVDFGVALRSRAATREQ